MSFVGFSFLFKARAFFDAFCVFLLVGVGDECSLVEVRERLPLGGVGAERSIKVLMLAVCAMSVCTGVCAAAVREERLKCVCIVGNGTQRLHVSQHSLW